MIRAGIAGLLALAITVPAAAQDIPDRASVTVPEISGGRDAQVVRNGQKYYYFWREGVTYEEAYTDLADCFRFLPRAEGRAALLPMFIAWRGAPEDRDDTAPPVNNYGLVGALIGALLDSSGTDRVRQGRLQVCLEPLGYQRFPVAKDTWKEINDGFSPQSIAVMAKIASGPRPDADPVEAVQ